VIETLTKLQYCSEEAIILFSRIMLLSLHIALILQYKLKLWSGVFQRRTATRSFAWFIRNNQDYSPNAGRSQHSLRLTTQ